MPIYEYRCTACGTQIEVMQGINDKPLKKCRKCSGKLEKLISRTSFQLKGGGWYDSGYSKSEGKKKDPKDSSTDTSKPKKSAGKKKAAAKKGTKTAAG